MTGAEPDLVLRPLVPEDARTIGAWGADEAFCRAAGWSVRPVADLEAFHRRVIADPPPQLLRLGAVADGRLVGYVDLHGDEPARRELGFLVGPRSVWGRGLGGAAARAALRHGLDDLRLEEVWAEALDANRASVRILRGLGMEETGWGEEGTYLGAPSRYRRFALRAS